MQKRKISTTWKAFFFAFSAFVLVNAAVLIGLKQSQVDLTEEGLYTLSPSTRQVLTGMKAPVTLTYYFSEQAAAQVPSLRLYGQRVREMLEQYALRAGDKISLTIVDPQPFSDTEDQAQAAGVDGIPLTADGDKLFMGLAGTSAQGEKAAIAFFAPEKERFLEYDLTRMLLRLSMTEKPLVGIISDLPLQTGSDGIAAAMQNRMDPWQSYLQLKSFYNVRHLPSDLDKIDEDIDLLLLAHPKDLTDEALYAIDQYALQGRPVLAFVDPLSEADLMTPKGPGAQGQGASSTLPKLLDSWGVHFNPEEVTVDRTLATQVAFQGRPVRYLPWLGFGRERMNGDSPITAELAQVNMASAGTLAPIAGSKATFTPLITTTSDGAQIHPQVIQLMTDPNQLLDGYTPLGRPLAVAAQIGGVLQSAFADEKNNPLHLKQSAQTAKIIVVADTDILDDRMWISKQQGAAVPVASNGAFLLNALDSLMGDGVLISLRSRGVANRPFTVINDLRATAEKQYRAKEQDLTVKLDEAKNKLLKLGTGEDLSPEQEAEVIKLRDVLAETRQALRTVQRELIDDVEALETRLKVINITAVPLLILVIALGLALRRQRQRRRL